MRTVAVIGAGISVLAAAYLLSRRHRVRLFEKEARLGGHTNTVVVSTPAGSVPLDTGFLVHNDRTYPNLVRLFGELDVATRDSDMSFSVSCQRCGLEYSSRGANGFFAQRRNLMSPTHRTLLREIARFNREAPALLEAPDAKRQTLGDFLESRRFGESFTHRYLFPMASDIWSASLDAIRSFPAITLIRFFDNHGLLSLHEQPTWKVVAGGSHTYIPKLTAPLSDNVHERAEIHGVRRRERGVTIDFRDRPSMLFDDVVFACHGDQVLPLLADPSDREREVLSNFTTTTDVASPEQYCVTLNPDGQIDERRVLRRLVYRHPLYTREANNAQERWRELSGVNRTHYCGAYWFHGSNWASSDDRDHLGDPTRSLRDRLAVDATRHGIDVPDGRIFLLTHLRYLGYGFNPVSFFYCFDAAERLRVVLAEVSNTFGGSHNYWLRPGSASRTFRSSAAKSVYVSPFMPVDVEYTFAFTPPAESLVAHMEISQAGSVGFDATLSLERRPWTADEIRRALVRYPAMTARMMAGIHWEALKLWWKGVPVVPRVTADGVGERAAQTAMGQTGSWKE